MNRLLLAAALCMASSAGAQVRASEQGTVSQVVNGTRITVDYARPQLRGRDSLFHRLTHVGDLWTPGANWATTLEVDRDVTIEGRPLPKGKYSMWMIAQREEWTFVLSRMVRLYHTQRPPADSEALRLPLKPVNTPVSVEMLTFSFPAVSPQGTRLQMQWHTTTLSLAIGVGSSRPNVIARADAEKYVGVYRLKWGAGMGPAGVDTFRVTLRDGILRGRLGRGLWRSDPDFDLLPQGSHRFRPYLYRDGKPFDAEDGSFEFIVTDGPAREVHLVGLGLTFARAERIP